MGLVSYDIARLHVTSAYSCHGRLKRIPLERCSGLVLAEELIAEHSNPRFDNSSVDGYALACHADAHQGTRLYLGGSIAAGEKLPINIPPGTTLRVLTGARLPKKAYAVVMQEDVVHEGGEVVLGSDIAAGANIRKAGDEFEAGTRLLPRFATITPGVAALLASQGVQAPLTFEPTRHSVVVTGDEIVATNQRPNEAQLFDSNGVMLNMLAERAGGESQGVFYYGDDKQSLTRALLEFSLTSDLIIVSGGASVGDRDYLADAVGGAGEVIFHGVAIRPGKPVLFGKVGKACVFGMPGNPGSAFVCFHLFVAEAIKRIGGNGSYLTRWISMPYAADHDPIGREEFVRVAIAGGEAQPVDIQESFGLRSLADADGLARLPADQAVRTGDIRPVLLL